MFHLNFNLQPNFKKRQGIYAWLWWSEWEAIDRIAPPMIPLWKQINFYDSCSTCSWMSLLTNKQYWLALEHECFVLGVSGKF